jgi:phosphoribosylaminoimidazolecarboxamide formyltransferase / IMP cyclohydrolase
MQRAALLSVSDKTGLEDFARGLEARGLIILASGGTGTFLQSKGIKVVQIDDYTGQEEILGGRVKTLHPKIHGGLLARQDDAGHLAELAKAEIIPIAVAAVNLYPFEGYVYSDTALDADKMIELVDIGGPAMLRAAAKNFKSIYSVLDPADYDAVLTALDKSQESTIDFRRSLAVKVFQSLAHYNLLISRYFSNVSFGDTAGEITIDTASEFMTGGVTGVVLEKAQELRYGENPHQAAAVYTKIGQKGLPWKQYQGKELSYNNLLDFDAACRICASLTEGKAAAVIVKHLNPCGAAVRESLAEALVDAKRGDPRSHFGGVISFNQVVDEVTAIEASKDFVEIIVAPGYSKAALEIFSKKKNVRVLELPMANQQRFEFRSINGAMLIQETDSTVTAIEDGKLVSTLPIPCECVEDLQIAWALCSHVKSNAIVVVKDGMLLTSGGGQMSRIDATEVALMKADIHEHDLRGAVAASDAFFPFPDCIERLATAGVVAIVAPGGAMRDDEAIAEANSRGLALVFTSDRHFRH